MCGKVCSFPSSANYIHITKYHLFTVAYVYVPGDEAPSGLCVHVHSDEAPSSMRVCAR